jgi:hypothetical protein
MLRKMQISALPGVSCICDAAAAIHMFKHLDLTCCSAQCYLQAGEYNRRPGRPVQLYFSELLLHIWN